MALPSSTATTSGGEALATHTIGAAEAQTFYRLDPSNGHLIGTLDAYTVCLDNVASAALTANTRKDMMSIHHAGTATKTVRIRRITVGGFQTTALVGTAYMKVFRGTAAPTAGTPIGTQPINPASAAAEVTVNSLPTITAATLLHTGAIGFLSAATAQTGFPQIMLYDDREDVRALVLRSGVLESLVLAVYSNVAHNLTLQVTVYFTEE